MNEGVFSPYTIKGVTLKNRIVMSPMCMYSSTDENGKLQAFHWTHYISRAVGGVGLVMLEATAISPEGRISSQDLGIWNDEHVEDLKMLVAEMQTYGTKTAIQLAHAGRKATVDGKILAPSAIAFNENFSIPNEMTYEDIKQTIEAFQNAASRAKQASFDIIELHGAHGYLINEFLSPLTNKREDIYGGNQVNRYRFLKDIIDAVKEVWDGALFVRISANDYQKEGLTVNDYITYCKWMKEQGVDLIDVSSGGVVPASIDVYPGYQIDYGEKIRQHVKVATGAVGMITSGLQAEEIIRNERADLVFIGRALLKNPYLPKVFADELDVPIDPPKQYSRGW
ncbi:NADPH dehydrogenase NamA [Bacillus carboniphilus]|uniref:NADPH dehydrogenase NamA n=1 Tax=Bacillus carboniphilus TaxID=86663 RepID=A0ABY9JZT1_9BACI|nr:NADPH dehydrogenase NamA [Bacillus carboniphilus]WLR43848.1 NADPH dehydrogenase NamA [Bacillus carboniphilus]